MDRDGALLLWSAASCGRSLERHTNCHLWHHRVWRPSLRLWNCVRDYALTGCNKSFQQSRIESVAPSRAVRVASVHLAAEVALLYVKSVARPPVLPNIYGAVDVAAVPVCLNFMAGSPSRLKVRRTLRSVMADLAWMMASPSAGYGARKADCTMSLFMTVCGAGWFRPLEARTATAPPFGASINVTPSGCSYTSWKKPLRQSMVRKTGRDEPLVRAVAAVLSKRLSPDHWSSEP